ncbi:flavin reductase family protein [Microbulbifer spongiae]|uniref:Flavin reductase family protein n=1 Tax=Microbulbifer spongiae TaxID=2944933 RepID=A0ABY9EGY5_9GAMM|nr:flavin reductase family protein [Microbulbifer sp. MI-G]WKD51562.1 flavin reductase family protein [Microbulbifer sp. MI-G]
MASQDLDIDVGKAMKLGMRRLASGVCILSTKCAEGTPFAMTVSSVTSVSDTPPSLLVCVNNTTSTGEVLRKGVPFCINVLSYNQELISRYCASSGSKNMRFSDSRWKHVSSNGVPYLEGAQAVFFCEQDKTILYNTHDIVIGRIQEVLVEAGPVSSLIYLDGSYQQP